MIRSGVLCPSPWYGRRLLKYSTYPLITWEDGASREPHPNMAGLEESVEAPRARARWTMVGEGAPPELEPTTWRSRTLRAAKGRRSLTAP